MSGRDDRAADALADREGIPCSECGGEGFWAAGGDFDDVQYIVCPQCDGTGYWKPAP